MITVIIAGGSGTRLWPLSTPEYPKHLLALTSDRTLLQQSYDRAKQLGGAVYVVTEAGHAEHIKKQLPELDDDAFIIEPGRRGTAHCIVMALDYIVRRHDYNDPIAFIHSDHHVRDIDGFQHSFETAARVSQQQNAITLIGIEPTFPATGFGYIERGESIDEDRGVYKVASFKEKPDYDTAQQYVDSGGYLWNCGYFVGSANTFLNEMQKVAPDLKSVFDSLAGFQDPTTDSYKETYLALDTKIIDFALIEKAESLAVVAASFDWMDIGSFKDLHNAVDRDAVGNHLHGVDINTVDVENAYIRNEEDKPVVVIGLDNIVVVNTPSGVLVARRDVSHLNGEVAKKLHQQSS
jgi:mannose-1-phosphate guanylyltransferase